MEDMYVVEYSVKQRQFHIEELYDAIKVNREIAYNRLPSDYLIIAMCDSHEEASDFICRWKQITPKKKLQ